MTQAPSRVVIENARPLVDGGRFAAKAVAGRPRRVSADVFCDGHDRVAAAVQVRRRGLSTWIEHPMHNVEQDCFAADVVLDAPGTYDVLVVVDDRVQRIDGLVVTAGEVTPFEIQVE